MKSIVFLVLSLTFSAVFCQTCTGPKRTLSVSDFDGNSVVNADDIVLIAQSLDGPYISWYDLNVDGVVDGLDVTLAVQDLGLASSLLDQQLAVTYLATEKYRNQTLALEENWILLDQTLAGHGEHWTNFVMLGPIPGYPAVFDNVVTLAQPEGLLYTFEGELIGVYWVVIPYTDPATDPSTAAADGLFDSPDAMWHTHMHTCQLHELPQVGVPMEFCSDLAWNQCVDSVSCTEAQGNAFPSLYMLHAWIHSLNACGDVFAALNTAVDPTGCPEPNHHACHFTDCTEPYSCPFEVRDRPEIMTM